MKNFKNLIAERLKADSATIPDTNAENFGDVTEKNSDDVPKVENAAKKSVEPSPSIQSADDVPIYTATSKEIEYWHACVNIHILDFLYPYDLSRGTVAFESFRIGVDDKNHAATFALDDTHYLKIDLNDTNVWAIDEEQAEKVLRKVNAMRFEKIKDSPRYPFGFRTWRR